jgi:hypothetical protein
MNGEERGEGELMGLASECDVTIQIRQSRGGAIGVGVGLVACRNRRLRKKSRVRLGSFEKGGDAVDCID